MGANVECEELGCVVGGPFKPNKLREVRGLVWRPWINKPSEMTMRGADICHHTAPVSKHKPPKLFLSPSFPVSYFVPLLPSLPLSYLLHLSFLHFKLFFLTPSSLGFVCFSTPALPYPSPISPFLRFMSPQWLHPSIRSSMHAWLAVRPGFCMCYRQRYGTALALSSRDGQGSGPESVYLSKREAVRLLTTAFLLFSQKE